MLSLKRPIDIVAIGFATVLALIAFVQWRESRSFVAGAVETTARVVEIRTEKKVLLDAQASKFATVEYTAGSDAVLRQELPTALRTLGLEEEGLVGRTIPIRYDPSEPRRIRYGESQGGEGALVLLALAIGALFVPWALRNSVLGRAGGG